MTLDELLERIHFVLEGGDDLFQHKIEIKVVRLSDKVAVPARGKLINLISKDQVGDSSFQQVIAVDYFDQTTEKDGNAWTLWNGKLDESTMETLVRDLVDAIEEDSREFDDFEDGYYDEYDY